MDWCIARVALLHAAATSTNSVAVSTTAAAAGQIGGVAALGSPIGSGLGSPSGPTTTSTTGGRKQPGHSRKTSTGGSSGSGGSGGVTVILAPPSGLPAGLDAAIAGRFSRGGQRQAYSANGHVSTSGPVAGNGLAQVISPTASATSGGLVPEWRVAAASEPSRASRPLPMPTKAQQQQQQQQQQREGDRTATTTTSSRALQEGGGEAGDGDVAGSAGDANRALDAPPAAVAEEYPIRAGRDTFSSAEADESAATHERSEGMTPPFPFPQPSPPGAPPSSDGAGASAQEQQHEYAGPIAAAAESTTAAAPAGPDHDKPRRLRARAVAEIISTERSYLGHLLRLTNLFVRPLKGDKPETGDEYARLLGLQPGQPMPGLSQEQQQALAMGAASGEGATTTSRPNVKEASTDANSHTPVPTNGWTGPDPTTLLSSWEQETMFLSVDSLLVRTCRCCWRYSGVLLLIVSYCVSEWRRRCRC